MGGRVAASPDPRLGQPMRCARATATAGAAMQKVSRPKSES